MSSDLDCPSTTGRRGRETDRPELLDSSVVPIDMDLLARKVSALTPRDGDDRPDPLASAVANRPRVHRVRFSTPPSHEYSHRDADSDGTCADGDDTTMRSHLPPPTQQQSPPPCSDVIHLDDQLDVKGEVVSTNIMVALLDRPREMRDLVNQNGSLFATIRSVLQGYDYNTLGTPLSPSPFAALHHENAMEGITTTPTTSAVGDAFESFQQILYAPRSAVPDVVWISQLGQYLAHVPAIWSKFQDMVGYEPSVWETRQGPTTSHVFGGTAFGPDGGMDAPHHDYDDPYTCRHDSDDEEALSDRSDDEDRPSRETTDTQGKYATFPVNWSPVDSPTGPAQADNVDKNDAPIDRQYRDRWTATAPPPILQMPPSGPVTAAHRPTATTGKYLRRPSLPGTPPDSAELFPAPTVINTKPRARRNSLNLPIATGAAEDGDLADGANFKPQETRLPSPTSGVERRMSPVGAFSPASAGQSLPSPLSGPLTADQLPTDTRPDSEFITTRDEDEVPGDNNGGDQAARGGGVSRADCRPSQQRHWRTRQVSHQRSAIDGGTVPTALLIPLDELRGNPATMADLMEVYQPFFEEVCERLAAPSSPRSLRPQSSSPSRPHSNHHREQHNHHGYDHLSTGLDDTSRNSRNTSRRSSFSFSSQSSSSSLASLSSPNDRQHQQPHHMRPSHHHRPTHEHDYRHEQMCERSGDNRYHLFCQVFTTPTDTVGSEEWYNTVAGMLRPWADLAEQLDKILECEIERLHQPGPAFASAHRLSI
ncbi:hypothetical protein IWQ60_009679 [Tieghemiomyces parasiticus]|uniref:Uncharacterized protein n=1 Tax=Tieghemiomyces parasiticus TaxID=78921 RepID=A0A9W7ZWV7_9FUNG|nr:hypothetical protein IWQ60_009679 [Tieghemiomyces parasiticus]